MIDALPLATLLAIIAPGQIDAGALKGYGELLDTHVKNGRVDYKAIASKDMPKLDAFVKAVGEAKPPTPRDARIAFYVDAYNAIVIKAVIENGRPRSVLDVKDFFKVAKYAVAGERVSLDQLEKEKLNPFAKDPRTHFVLVCGAVGCPILESKPFTGSNVSTRMDAATRRYLTSPIGAKVSAGTIALSKIFDWYKGDFGGDEGVLTFAKKHLPDAEKAKLGDKPKVEYIDYNWTLNQQ